MADAGATSEYLGLLVIGDPHLEGRTPGFRRDDYPNVVLEKLRWSINYAAAHRLLPILLGDLFDKPRDNPNWLIIKLIDLLDGAECIGIYGNHDCADPALTEHDSLSILVRAGRLRLLDDRHWEGVINGQGVVIGGSSYRKALPKQAPACDLADPFVVWLTHHDLIVPGYEEQGYHKPREIPGVHLVINGHIHRRLVDVPVGQTLWMTPGNISRRSRNDATRAHVPSVLRVDIGPRNGVSGQVGVGQPKHLCTYIQLPHQQFDEVFHAAVAESVTQTQSGSAFIAGMTELLARRTASGAGLGDFLAANVTQFETDVAREILSLAGEVISEGASDETI